MKRLVMHFNLSLFVLVVSLLIPKYSEATYHINKSAKTFLWKIEKENHPTSYLLGTLHIGKRGDELPLYITDRLSETNGLVTEVHMDKIDDFDAIFPLMLGFNKPLKDVLGQERFQKIDELFGSEGIAIDPLTTLRPWTIILELLNLSIPQNYDSAFGTERLLVTALSSKQEKFGLETLEAQIKLLSELSDERVIEVIDAEFSMVKSAKQDSLHLVKLYEENDIKALYDFVTDKEYNLRGYPEETHEFWWNWYYETLLVSRNKNWIPLLKAHLETQSIFIAVGASHLPGEEGLIQLLRNEDYTLIPIMPIDNKE